MKKLLNQCYDSVKALVKSNRLLFFAAKKLKGIYRKYQYGYQTFPGINGKIHFNDDSLVKGNYKHYLQVAESAIKNIDQALVASSQSFDRLNSCLDFPCGYGRVLRLLVDKIDPGLIWACDLNKEAVHFCQKEFKVNPFYSISDFSRITFPRAFDLIWIGSLITHLKEQDFLDLLKLVYSSLNPGGVVVFTTHGKYSINLLEQYRFRAENKEQISKTLVEKGYFYYPYPGGENYGISLCSEEYVTSTIARNYNNGFKQLFYNYRGWDNHQDVYAYQKIGSR